MTAAGTAPDPVAVDALTKHYPGVRAVDGVSFALGGGAVTGFLGPNGAGKTTTLRMIGGLIRPTSGQALLSGVDAQQPRARQRLGYMPADPVFLPHLSGTANLDLIAALHRSEVPDRAAMADALELSPADLDRDVGAYSSGMRQKLAIVAAFQHRPDVVVLDEPANRLDPIAHRRFCAAVREYAGQGGTVLLSSHVLAEVEAVCDDVILIREGRLLRTAAVDDLREQASRVVTLTYRRPPASVPQILGRAVVEGVEVRGRIPRERLDLVRRLLDEPDLVDVRIEPPSLEDIVLELYLGAAP